MKKNKLALKIVALLIAVCLIGVILSITNAFIGNPISVAFADKAIKDYVAQNYPSLDLEIEKPHYNFKFSEYVARAKSKTSMDTHFSIYYRNGKVQRDDYESYVLGKYNTLSRLEDEYSKLIIPILAEITGLENNRSMVQFEKWEYEKANKDIKIDMKFDKALLFDMKVTIRADLRDISLKNIANILEDSHKALTVNGCKFNSYDIFSECDGVLVMISDITPSDMQSGDLEKLLNDAQNYEGNELGKGMEKDNKKSETDNRIRVFIKNNKEKNSN